MLPTTKNLVLLLLGMSCSISLCLGDDTVVPQGLDPTPFGDEFPSLDGWATGQWWTKPSAQGEESLQSPAGNKKKRRRPPVPFQINIPRDEVIAFAIYTVTVPPGTPTASTLKLSAQLFPLKPGESNQVRLEVDRGTGWTEIGKATINYPGWDASFRIPKWDATKSVPYRVRHGEHAEFSGVIRPDPATKSEISVAVM